MGNLPTAGKSHEPDCRQAGSIRLVSGDGDAIWGVSIFVANPVRIIVRSNKGADGRSDGSKLSVVHEQGDEIAHVVRKVFEFCQVLRRDSRMRV
jgi:hypothetical protein